MYSIFFSFLGFDKYYDIILQNYLKNVPEGATVFSDIFLDRGSDKTFISISEHNN